MKKYDNGRLKDWSILMNKKKRDTEMCIIRKIRGRYSMFFSGRQKVFAYSFGLKHFYDLKHMAFFHFVQVILIFGFLRSKR